MSAPLTPPPGILVAPSEPPVVKSLGKVSQITERYGADILWGSPVLGLCAVQRKELGDLVASIADGRLGKEVAQMQEVTGLRALVVEGRPRWTTDGQLLSCYTKVTRHQLRSLLWSVRSKGVWVDYSDDTGDTVELISQLHTWTLKSTHESMNRLPGPKGDSWGVVSNEDYARHLLSALPGVGVELAARVLEHFGGVPISWDVTEDELRQVPGIGNSKARKMMRALEVEVEQRQQQPA